MTNITGMQVPGPLHKSWSIQEGHQPSRRRRRDAGSTGICAGVTHEVCVEVEAEEEGCSERAGGGEDR